MSKVVTTVQNGTELPPREYKPRWSHIIAFMYLHLAGIYGISLLFQAKVYTLLWLFLILEMSVLGITAGNHRLWAHRSYKVTLPLKVILVVFQTLGQQGSVIGWSHNHRLHHKYSDTDADPHNASRGLFYSHIGWLLCQYHPDVLEKRKGIDVSDLTSDPVLAFQKKYFLILMPIMAFIMPVAVPVYFWNESWVIAFHVNVFRYLIGAHTAFIINSWAHTFGYRPYDRNIRPGDNVLCSFITLGEGYHNYHHAFPWDYKTSEWGSHGTSWTTAFIDLMAKIGWAYNMKIATPDMVMQAIEKRGDGTHEIYGKQ